MMYSEICGNNLDDLSEKVIRIQEIAVFQETVISEKPVIQAIFDSQMCCIGGVITIITALIAEYSEKSLN